MSEAHSPTGGVRPFPIGGRLVNERQRLQGMTPAERAWRAQYLKDQILSHNEPRSVPEYWKEIRNPIRRFYTTPLRIAERVLTPVIVSVY
jgi:NADH dehydrogenase (ubiquinone) 1 beta subcomplex subunit 6